jgi:flagellar hook-basal body complex protein FliE
MTFPIPPVAPPQNARRVVPTQPTAPTPQTPQSNPAGAGGGFTDAVADALAGVSEMEGRVVEAGQQAATGDLNSVSDFMIASAEAQLATEITVAIRDRAIAAFNDIMRMQI